MLKCCKMSNCIYFIVICAQTYYSIRGFIHAFYLSSKAHKYFSRTYILFMMHNLHSGVISYQKNIFSVSALLQQGTRWYVFIQNKWITRPWQNVYVTWRTTVLITQSAGLDSHRLELRWCTKNICTYLVHLVFQIHIGHFDFPMVYLSLSKKSIQVFVFLMITFAT